MLYFFAKCGQGSTDDELSPTCVSSLLGIRIEGVAAGLWHTVCVSADGDVYAFGGNQFGQLGTGADQAEVHGKKKKKKRKMPYYSNFPFPRFKGVYTYT